MTRAHGGAAIVDEVLDDLRKPFDSVGRSTEGGIDSRDARRDDHSTIYRRVQHFVPEFGETTALTVAPSAVATAGASTRPASRAAVNLSC